MLQTPPQQYLQERETASADLPGTPTATTTRSPPTPTTPRLPIRTASPYTRDRQYQSGGRVYDHFSSTTYSVERSRSVR
ncbi:MAG: hypothetical protein R3C45_09520 [Phycisphaerales bacterium]